MAAGAGAAAGLIVLAVLVPVGIVVGTIVGAASALSEETVQENEAQLTRAFKETDIQGILHAEVVDDAEVARALPVVDLKDVRTPAENGGVDLAELRETGVDSILELKVEEMGLSGKKGGDPELFLYLSVTYRIFDTARGTHLYENQVTHRSPTWRFTKWGARNAKLLREQLNVSAHQVAQAIVDQVFLEVWAEYD